MPCDSVQRTAVNMNNLKVDSLDLLKAALEALGYTVSVSGTTLYATHRKHGSLSYEQRTGALQQETDRRRQTPIDVSEIKVGYSKQVVRKVATKFGWSLKEQAATSDLAAAFTASKKSF